MARARGNLAIAAQLCPTWMQSCVFAMDGEGPDEAEQDAYVEFLRQCLADGIALKGVLLYGLARRSLQPEASRLGPLSAEQLGTVAQRIRALGLAVKVTP